MYRRKQSEAVTPAMKPETMASVLPKDTEKYTADDIFRYVVWALQDGRELHWDFRRLKGGPYGYSLPATIVWGFDRQARMVHGKIMWAGYPSIAFGFPARMTEKMVYDYLRKPYFERVQHTDQTGFKIVVAMASQIERPAK